MSVLRFAAVALAIGFVSLTVRSVSKEYAVYVSVAAAVILLAIIFAEASGVYERLKSLLAVFEGQTKIIASCGKMIAIAYIAEIAASILESAEEKGIADKMRLFGKLAIFSSCLPLLGSFADMVLELV